jgi:hypothetical protein
MKTSENIAELAKALAEAQLAYPSIGKDKTGKVKGRKKDGTEYDFEYEYADLATVLDAIRPVLAKHGLAVVQSASAERNVVTVITRLLHASGQWIESSLSVEAENAAPQKLGSAISYARRYGLLALAGVAPGGEDDDGQQANHDRKPSPRPEKVGDTMRRAVQRHPGTRIKESLAWLAKNHGEEHVRDVLAKIVGRTFPVDKEILLVLSELETLEKHIILAEAERQTAQGTP